MHGFFEIGALTVLALGNTPWYQPNYNWVTPRLKYEIRANDYLFVGGVSSARCDPQRMIRWNPQTALWDVHVGLRFSGIQLKLGHTSEHGIDKIVRLTESFDYADVSYRVTF